LIKSYLPEGFDPVSFVSDRNTNVDSVQFAMMTAGIEKAEAPEAPAQAAEEPDFWERLLALFGL
jgi:putative membrane protein